jgi:hypothetical protein
LVIIHFTIHCKNYFGYYPKMTCNDRIGAVYHHCSYPYGRKEMVMSGENAEGTAIKIKPEEAGKRQRSSIGFPYMDLNEAITLAKAIHNNVGTGTCTLEQLAPWVKQSPTSSGFRSRLAASRLFGLINADRSDALFLTELGRLVVDAKREREGRARAFLSVPLFSALHDKFKGSVVPPAAALEKELAALGVASTLTDTARRVMERSAEEAGFYEAGRDRLVMPGFVPSVQREEEKPAEEEPSNGGGGNGSGGKQPPIDPIIAGLLARLPKSGDVWAVADRKLWLQLLEGSFQLIYKDAPAKLPPVPYGENNLLEAAEKLAWKDDTSK